MVENSQAINSVLQSLHATMVSCKGSIKSRALLRNLTDLSPVLMNLTRWSSAYNVLSRFNRIRTQIIAVAISDKSDLAVNMTPVFKSNCEKYEKHFKEINTITLELQTRGLSLADCRLALDILIKAVRDGKNDLNSNLYGCTLDTFYIDSKAQIVHSPDFESGVVKIQNRKTDELSDAEKLACKKLERTAVDITNNNSTSNLSLTEQVSLGKRKRQDASNNYMNTSFVLGSTAELERLWSIAKNILTNNRQETTPLVFESILFLNVNKTYLNEYTVKEAMGEVTSERESQRLQEDGLTDNIIHGTELS